MAKVEYVMDEDQVLDAIEVWIRTHAKALKLPDNVHFDLKADEKRGFYVEITRKEHTNGKDS